MGYKCFCERLYSNTNIHLACTRYLITAIAKAEKTAQVKGAENAYLAVDDIENGVHRTIPLWLFGFLY